MSTTFSETPSGNFGADFGASASANAGVPRVVASESALALIDKIARQHGAIMFYQSHGCCDGSTPMCLKQGEMALAGSDVQLGEIGGVPYYVGQTQLEYLQGGQLIIDAKPGSLGTFSLDDAEGQHFTATQRLWSDEEWAWLQAHPLADSAR